MRGCFSAEWSESDAPAAASEATADGGVACASSHDLRLRRPDEAGVVAAAEAEADEAAEAEVTMVGGAVDGRTVAVADGAPSLMKSDEDDDADDEAPAEVAVPAAAAVAATADGASVEAVANCDTNGRRALASIERRRSAIDSADEIIDWRRSLISAAVSTADDADADEADESTDAPEAEVAIDRRRSANEASMLEDAAESEPASSIDRRRSPGSEPSTDRRRSDAPNASAAE